MRLTKEQRINTRTRKGGYTKQQVESLGLTWPAPKGWPKADYPPEKIEAFLKVSERLRTEVPRVISEMKIAETTQDKAFEAVAVFLIEYGWERINEVSADFGQWIDPRTKRTHDLDYAFTLQLCRIRVKYHGIDSQE